jgi:hypothetical protein
VLTAFPDLGDDGDVGDHGDLSQEHGQKERTWGILKIGSCL